MEIRVLGVLMAMTLVMLQASSGNKPDCRDLYLRSKDLGFCWYFVNGNITMSDAEALCKLHEGHLPAVNSFSKAEKLAKFAGSMRMLYVNGSFHHSWLPVYAGGWKGTTLWTNRIWKLGNSSDDVTRVWGTSNVTVSYQGYINDINALQVSDSCGVFDMQTAKWQFSVCDGVNTVICEENGHDYDNDRSDPDWDSEGEEIHTYNATSCPTDFILSRGRCLRLGHVSRILAADQFCKHRNGFLAVVTNANDEKELGAFVAKWQHGSWGSFLSPVEYKDKGFVWTSTGQSAEYVAQKFELLEKPGLPLDTLLTFTPVGKLTTCDRHMCKARPFCQANGDD